MKVKRKTEITDAVRYERGKGMEDGFLYGQYDHENGFYAMAHDDIAALQIPYVYDNNISDNMIFIEEGDYIVTDNKGNKSVYSPDIFESLYDICTIDCEPDGCPPERVARHEQTMDTIIHRLDHLEGKLGKMQNMVIDDQSIGRLINAGL